MVTLPLRLTLEQMQARWKSIIDPLLTAPMASGVLLPDVSLLTGDNTINTLLSRQQQGWIVVDKTSAAVIYRSRPFNSQTLTLNSSAPCTVSLMVY